MSIIIAGIGFVVLITGRLFYVSFVAGAGFLSVFWAIIQLGLIDSEWNAMWISLVIGVLIGISAFELKRWVAGAAAFVAGGFLLFNLPAIFYVEVDLAWPFFLLAGGLCLVLALTAFDLALVMLSVLTGATMIVPNMNFGDLDPVAMFIVLVVFGLITQFILLRNGECAPD